VLKEKYFKHKALRSDFEITLETLRIVVVEKLSENKLQRSHSVTILLLCISFVLRGKAAEGERLYLGDSSFSSKYLSKMSTTQARSTRRSLHDKFLPSCGFQTKIQKNNLEYTVRNSDAIVNRVENDHVPRS